MEVLINSFLLVLVSEMGDKTQILALVLTTRYRKPWAILCGVLISTLANHFLASIAGEKLAGFVSPWALKWSLALIIFAFAAWILIPDHESEIKTRSRYGAFFTTVIAFFIAEMGDKTQLVTAALGARYSNPFLVTIGTTLGVIAADALAIFLGQRFLSRIPVKWVKVFALVLYLTFGTAILLR